MNILELYAVKSKLFELHHVTFHTESKGQQNKMQLKHTEQRKDFVFKSSGSFHDNYNITLLFSRIAQC